MEHFEFYPTCIINVMLTLILIFCTAEANQSLQEQKWDQSLIYEPLKGWTLPSYEKSTSFSLTVKGLRKPPPAVYKVTHQLTTISCILTKSSLLVQRQWTFLSSEQQTVCFMFELPMDIYHQCPSSAGAGSASHVTTAHVGNWNQKLMKHIENIGLQGNLPDLCPRRSDCLLYWKTNKSASCS